MPSIDTLLTFGLAALLLSVTPGPSNLYVMARSMNQGKHVGMVAASGLAVGSFIYVIATALGIAAIFKYSPLAYTVTKLAGSGYLIYLGIQYIRTPPPTTGSNIALKDRSYSTIFKQSIVVELTNPKTALFFIAFLPQFVTSDAGSITSQLLILGSFYALIAFGCDLVVAKLSSKLGTWLAQHHAFTYWQDKVSGSILFGLGSYIGLNEIAEL